MVLVQQAGGYSTPIATPDGDSPTTVLVRVVPLELRSTTTSTSYYPRNFAREAASSVPLLTDIILTVALPVRVQYLRVRVATTYSYRIATTVSYYECCTNTVRYCSVFRRRIQYEYEVRTSCNQLRATGLPLAWTIFRHFQASSPF